MSCAPLNKEKYIVIMDMTLSDAIILIVAVRCAHHVTGFTLHTHTHKRPELSHAHTTAVGHSNKKL